MVIPDPSGGERTAICRASFATPAERARVATVGAIVGLLTDPENLGVITLATS